MKTLSAPCRVRNLTAWFILDPVERPCPDYAVLEGAMASASVRLHETGQVNQLLIENLGDADVFVQAGDMVKGGRQDRTLGVDFIVPARSGRIPVPVFCVESARWHKRRAESDQVFSSSAHFVASPKSRLALRQQKSQAAVWESVSEEQDKLGAALGASAHAAESPTSLHLSYDTEAVTAALRDYAGVLQAAPPEGSRGVVWSINGRLSHADAYGNPALFRKVWGKLLNGAALEAIAASRAKPSREPEPESADAVLAWLQATGDEPAGAESLPPRTRVETRRARARIRFDTHDTDAPTAVHVSVLTEGS